MRIFPGFCVFVYPLGQKNENPEMTGINRKYSKEKKHPFLTVTITRKLLKSYQFVILVLF